MSWLINTQVLRVVRSIQTFRNANPAFFLSPEMLETHIVSTAAQSLNMVQCNAYIAIVIIADLDACKRHMCEKTRNRRFVHDEHPPP